MICKVCGKTFTPNPNNGNSLTERFKAIKAKIGIQQYALILKNHNLASVGEIKTKELADKVLGDMEKAKAITNEFGGDIVE